MRSAVSILLLCTIYQHRVTAQERTRITHTDTSVIRTMIFGFRDRQDSFIYTAKLVEEFINGKDLVMERSYDRDTSDLLYESCTNRSLHTKTGMSRSYSLDGALRMTIDHGRRTWLPADTTAYPNYNVLNVMKLKGDSVLRSIYGAAFCKGYIRWSLNSYYFDSTYAAEPSLRWSGCAQEQKTNTGPPGSISDTTFAVKAIYTKTPSGSS